MRDSLGSLALVAGIFSGIAAAEAATIIMPGGSTVWMKMNSTACWNGVTAGADDCIASNKPGSNPANGIPTSTFTGSSISVTTSAEVLPDRVRSFVSSSASGFLHVSLEDTYTIHGSSRDPFNITVQLNLTGTMRTVGTGSCSICHQLIGGSNVQAEIGVFNHDSTNDINENLRVTAFNSGTSATFIADTIAASSPQSITFDITATHTLSNLIVGNTFSLAFGANSITPRGEIDMLNTGHISFVLPDGVFLTSALGGEFGERTDPSAVPVPAALPLFAGGLGVITLLGWRRKRKLSA